MGKGAESNQYKLETCMKLLNKFNFERVTGQNLFLDFPLILKLPFPLFFFKKIVHTYVFETTKYEFEKKISLQLVFIIQFTFSFIPVILRMSFLYLFQNFFLFVCLSLSACLYFMFGTVCEAVFPAFIFPLLILRCSYFAARV